MHLLAFYSALPRLQLLVVRICAYSENGYLKSK